MSSELNAGTSAAVGTQSLAAVVIDIGRNATRIGQAGDDRCTSGPALDLVDHSSCWLVDTSTALSALAAVAEISLERRHILITESIDQRNGPRESRERWVTLAFDHLGAASVYLAPQPCLALYLHGVTSGIVVDAVHAVPIYEGYAPPHAVKRLDGEGTSSAARAVSAAARALDPDLKETGQLLEHVVICGQNESKLESIVPEMQAEVEALVATWLGPPFPGQRTVRVHVHGGNEGAAWFGGGLLAGLDPGTSMWILRSEYDSEGAAVVHRKCL